MIDRDEIRRQMEHKENQELITILLEHDEDQWQPEVFDIVGAILAERGVSSGEDLKIIRERDVRAETEGLSVSGKRATSWARNDPYYQFNGRLIDHKPRKGEIPMRWVVSSLPAAIHQSG